MNNKLRNKIHDVLKENNLLKIWNEKVEEVEEVTCDVTSTDNDIAIAPNGTQYYKSLVIEYLNEKGYPFTPENINLVARMFQTNGGTYIRRNHKTIEHDEFEGISDEDVDIFLYLKILELFKELKDNITSKNFMDYAVEIINDNQNGSTNIQKLTTILKERSEKGWKLVNTFTNELGVNSHIEQSILSNNVRVNSTVDQIVMIFERPISITDKKAREIINQIQNS